ncbi:MAG: VWA domain-containing protein [Acidobacteriota bacterium]
MQRRFLALIFSFAWILTAGFSAVVAQDLDPAFGDVVDVRVVNIEVVVEDRAGNRIHGLGPDDLTLTVDGEPMEISYFTEVRGGRALEGAGGVPTAPETMPGEAVGTRYLVFIDDFFSIDRDRRRVLRELADDLAYLRPEDRVAVVAFDGRRVDLLTSWTGSEGKILDALRRAERRPAFGLQRLAERRAFGRSFGRRFSRLPDTRLSVTERAYAGQIGEQTERAVDAAVATLRGFGRPAGRKVMLLLSGGWPDSPALFAADDLLRPLVAFDGYSGRDLYTPLIDTANLLGYTLYPIDVPGLEGDFGADVSLAGRQRDLSNRRSFEQERILHDSLYRLAEETGGQPLINGRRLSALERVADDTRSYYWIGFVPERRRDNDAHEVRVRAKAKAMKVRARSGYRDLSRALETNMEVESALLFGGAAAEGGLAVDLGAAQRDGRRFVQIPVELVIPTDALTALPSADGAVTARLELRIAALDERNRRSEISAVPIELTFDEAPPVGGAVAYETSVRLRRQPQDLVVALHDPISGRGLMTRLAVAP